MEAVQSHGNSAVLMHGQRPVMDGWNATWAIRSLEDGRKRMLIIAVTASATQREGTTLPRPGMGDFLTKPIDPSTLHAAPSTVGAGHRAVRG